MKLSECLSQLSLLEKLHNEAIIIGFASSYGLPENELYIRYIAERRGKYGYIPSVYIWQNDKPIAVMVTSQAYRYANIGMSVILARDLMHQLGDD